MIHRLTSLSTLSTLPHLARSASFAAAMAATLVLTTAPAMGQSAQEIMETAIERYESRMEGIEDYTIVQTVGGQTDTTYHERRMVDGLPLYPPAGQDSDPRMDEIMERSAGGNPYAFFTQLASRADLQGTETVDGEETFVLAIDDMSGIDLGEAEAAGLQLTSARIWIDTDDHVVRRSVVNGTMRANGEDHELTLDASMTDYREVEGMLHPFRSNMEITGIDAMIPPEQREEMRQAMERMEEQLEQMPPAQREQMRQMMDERMGPMMSMMEGMDNGMTFTMEVQELIVNQGPPR